MDTDLLFLGLAENDLYVCKRSERKQEWELLRSKHCNDSFTADACRNFFCRTFCAKFPKNTTQQSLNCSRRSFDAPKCCAFLAKHTTVTTL